MLLAALLACLGDDSFPLGPGHRWTYSRPDGGKLVVEGIEELKAAGGTLTVLRVTGDAFLWTSSLQLLSADDSGLRAWSIDGARAPTSAHLLRFPMKADDAWEASMGEAYYGTHFRARIAGREEVEVPAGRFSAWKLSVKASERILAGYDFDAWYAPGTGFVRLRYTAEVERRRTPLEPAVIHDLVSFEKAAVRARNLPALREDQVREAKQFLQQLADESLEVRDAAARSLLALGWGVAPLLEETAKSGRDEEVRGRARDLLGRLPVLEASVRAVKDRMKVGERPPVEYRLRNLSPAHVRVLPCLHQSDTKRDFPRYRIEVRDAAGVLQTNGTARCCNVNLLLSSNFTDLEPGAETDPFLQGWHEMLEWKPARPGRYTFRMVYEMKPGPSVAGWALQPLVSGTLAGVFESKPVEILVEE